MQYIKINEHCIKQITKVVGKLFGKQILMTSNTKNL